MKKIILSMILVLISLNVLAEMSVYDRLLVKAVKNNDFVEAEKMLKKGASLRGSKGVSFWNSKEKPSIKMINVFHKYNTSIESNYDIKTSCLLYSLVTAKYPDKQLYEKVKILVDNGTDIHCYGRKSGGHSLIHRLAKLGLNVGDTGNPLKRRKSVEYILQKGAEKDLNKYFDGMKPLGYAAKWSHTEMIELLLKMGANINAATNDEGTFLIHYSARNNALEILKRILPKVNNINQVDNEGWTALDVAHGMERDDAELLLLEKGAKYNHYSLQPNMKLL